MLSKGMCELGQDPGDRGENPRLIVILCGSLPYQQQYKRPGYPAKQPREVPGITDFEFFFFQVSFSLVLKVKNHKQLLQPVRVPGPEACL